MKIVNDAVVPTTRLGDLSAGDVFEFNNRIYMLTDENPIVRIEDGVLLSPEDLGWPEGVDDFSDLPVVYKENARIIV
jgi:hypothetical protein